MVSGPQSELMTRTTPQESTIMTRIFVNKGDADKEEPGLSAPKHSLFTLML